MTTSMGSVDAITWRWACGSCFYRSFCGDLEIVDHYDIFVPIWGYGFLRWPRSASSCWRIVVGDDGYIYFLSFCLLLSFIYDLFIWIMIDWEFWHGSLFCICGTSVPSRTCNTDNDWMSCEEATYKSDPGGRATPGTTSKRGRAVVIIYRCSQA